LFDRLRDAFRAALDAATPPGDLRDLARQMKAAVVEAKVAVGEMREALGRTERELTLERQRLADTERRGRLAGEIQDQETADVAAKFATKYAERVAILERKLGAQRDELTLAERDLSEMHAQLLAADRGRPAAAAGGSAEAAWRDLQSAGGNRPGVDLHDELLKSDMDRAQREATADRQLEELKKRMRKE
jgi:Sec-independent protein translocase protein TatA